MSSSAKGKKSKMSDEERRTIQENIKQQGEIVRRLKAENAEKAKVSMKVIQSGLFDF